MPFALAPTFGNLGVALTSTGIVQSPNYPAIVAGDIAVLLVVSTNGEPNVLAVPADFVEMASSPQDSSGGIGTAAVVGACRLSLFWKQVNSDHPGNPQPVIAATPSERVSLIFTIKGAGNLAPDITAAGPNTASETGGGSVNGGTTTQTNTLVVCVLGQFPSGPNSFSAPANAALASILMETSLGNSGHPGFGIIKGTFVGPGAFGTTTYSASGTAYPVAKISFAFGAQNAYTAQLVESIAIIEQASAPTTPALFSMIGSGGQPNAFGMFGLSGFAAGIAAMGITIPVSESVSLAESLAALYSAIIAANETITISEAVAAVYAAIIAANETITISEAVAAVYAAIVGVSETVTLGESLAAQYSAVIAASESLSLSESLAAVLSCIVALSETVTVTEAIAVSMGIAIGLSESLALSESLTTVYHAIISSSETVTITEVVGASTAYAVSISETVSISESLAAIFAAVVAVSETLTIGEALTVTYHAILSTSETITITEIVGGAVAYLVGLSESITIGESLAALAAFVVNITDTDTLGESIVAGGSGGGGGTAVSETITITESLAAIMACTAAAAEAVSIGESLAALFGAVIASDTIDAVALGELVAGAMAAIVGAADTTSIAEALAASVPYARSVSETIALGETLTINLARSVAFAEGLTLGEMIAALGHFVPALLDLEDVEIMVFGDSPTLRVADMDAKISLAPSSAYVVVRRKPR